MSSGAQLGVQGGLVGHAESERKKKNMTLALVRLCAFHTCDEMSLLFGFGEECFHPWSTSYCNSSKGEKKSYEVRRHNLTSNVSMTYDRGFEVSKCSGILTLFPARSFSKT